MESFDSQWEGGRERCVCRFKNTLQKYCNDYQVSVQNLTTCVEGLDNLINEIPFSKCDKGDR